MKLKIIKRYICESCGFEFDNEEDCLEHEMNCFNTVDWSYWCLTYDVKNGTSNYYKFPGPKSTIGDYPDVVSVTTRVNSIKFSKYFPDSADENECKLALLVCAKAWAEKMKLAIFKDIIRFNDRVEDDT